MLAISFINRNLPEAVQRRLVAMLFDAPTSTVAYVIGVIIVAIAIRLHNGDVLLTAAAGCCVVLVSVRVVYVVRKKPAPDQATPPAYLPMLLVLGVAYAVSTAALVVRAFAIGDAVDIALVVMVASGYLSGLTLRAPAVPSIAITQTIALFVPLIIAAGIHPEYWSVAVLLLCHTVGSINLINTMHGRILSQLRAERELAMAAATDTLTDAVNRAAFDKAVTERLAAGSAIVAIVDLDQFKPVNDTHGHAAGDELLIKAVRRMTSAIGSGNIVGRIGGDEFALLFAGADVVEATRLAETIVHELEQPFTLAAATVEIGASVGMAVAVPGDTAQSLRHRADERLYDAKRAGRGRVAPARSQAAA